MTVSLPSPDAPFTTLAELIRSHARQQPAHAVYSPARGKGHDQGDRAVGRQVGGMDRG